MWDVEWHVEDFKTWTIVLAAKESFWSASMDQAAILAAKLES